MRTLDVVCEDLLRAMSDRDGWRECQGNPWQHHDLMMIILYKYPNIYIYIYIIIIIIITKLLEKCYPI